MEMVRSYFLFSQKCNRCLATGKRPFIVYPEEAISELQKNMLNGNNKLPAYFSLAPSTISRDGYHFDYSKN